VVKCCFDGRDDRLLNRDFSAVWRKGKALMEAISLSGFDRNDSRFKRKDYARIARRVCKFSNFPGEEAEQRIAGMAVASGEVKLICRANQYRKLEAKET
jgi:hypothetical protein